MENKDAFDVYYTLRNFTAGTATAVAGFTAECAAENPAFENAWQCLNEHFSSERSAGPVATAEFNTMIDIASRPPQSPRFRRDRSTLERRAGAWLREFTARSARADFSPAGYLLALTSED